MLATLQHLFANDIVPAIERGDLEGRAVDDAVLQWVRRDGATFVAMGEPIDLPGGLSGPAARGLSRVYHLTTGARKLVCRAQTLNEAIMHLFSDKLFKEYLRNAVDRPEVRAQLNRLLSAIPALAESGRFPRFAPTNQRNPGRGQAFNIDEIIAHLKTVDASLFRDFIGRLHNELVLERVRGLYARQNWDELSQLSSALASDSPSRHKTLLLVGRGAIYAGHLQDALRVLGEANHCFPDDPEVLQYRGAAHARSGDFESAIADLRVAVALHPTSVRNRRELGNVLRMGSRRLTDEGARRAMATEAIDLLTTTLNEDFTVAAARTLARFLYDCARFGACLEVVERALAAAPRDVDMLVQKSRVLVSLSRTAEALRVAERVLEQDPGNQSAQSILRTMRFLVGSDRSASELRFGRARYRDGALVVAPLGSTSAKFAPSSATISPLENLRALPYDWLVVAEDTIDEAALDLECLRSNGQLDGHAGFALESTPSGATVRLWRREALLALREAGLFGDSLDDLFRFERFYGPPRSSGVAGGQAVVMSRHGSFKFGGGEHFIESMADHYRSLGYDPVILGTREELRGQAGDVNGTRFVFVEDSPAVLRRFFLENDTRLVHAISGLGFAAADALAYTNIPFVYGVHFWREALGPTTGDIYFDEDGEPLARPDFEYVLSRATVVYANSDFTQEVLERAFGVRCPVIYSVPKEVGGHA